MTTNITLSDLGGATGVKFGTSGLRGLVVNMTDKVCYLYTLGFLKHMEVRYGLKKGKEIALAGDLRSSTPRIMRAVAKAVHDFGSIPLNCGSIPTPAVAFYGLENQIPAIMVTGSHIPDDRNGIKFYSPTGEILKADEQHILEQTLALNDALFDQDGNLTGHFSLPSESPKGYQAFVKRYTRFFPEDCLKGMRIGLYQHSAVSRDILLDILQKLGAEVLPFGRSETFIPVDTEAIRPEDVDQAKQWAEEHHLDCILSTDGDGDRPLISDQTGSWLRGDIAGLLCAQYLNADVVVTPVSSNTAVEKCNSFDQVIRTKVGSPYVIETMEKVKSGGCVVGYEANGGFIIGTEINRDGRTLAPLPTRDSVILPLCILCMALEKNFPISSLTQTLPHRFTLSDRVKNFPTEKSEVFLQKFCSKDLEKNLNACKTTFGSFMGDVMSIDQTDGVRITSDKGEVLHLRPSGNAPELRCYVETEHMDRSHELKDHCMALLEQWKAA